MKIRFVSIDYLFRNGYPEGHLADGEFDLREFDLWTDLCFHTRI